MSHPGAATYWLGERKEMELVAIQMILSVREIMVSKRMLSSQVFQAE